MKFGYGYFQKCWIAFAAMWAAEIYSSSGADTRSPGQGGRVARVGEVQVDIAKVRAAVSS